ncbi:MAG: CHASE domain-containing protein [Cyclobacteriaceae bacterium]|nr:CHASE domain-containing protein [Cyclobacteriaceae bacterium]
MKKLYHIGQPHPKWIGFWVFVIMMAITQFLSHQKYLYHKAKDQVRLEHSTHAVQQHLRDYLHQSLNVTYALRFFIEKEGLPEDFDALGKLLLDMNPDLHAVQVVEKGVITHVYPHEGNEGVIGYNILEDPHTKIEVEFAKEKGMYFAGPFELRQGGIGIVGRLAIYKNGQFWGFSAVVIKLENLLKTVGIYPSYDPDIFFQLSKVNPNTQLKENYIHDVVNSIKLTDRITHEIPEGDWIIEASLISGYSMMSVLPLSLMGILLSVTLAYLASFIAKMPFKLKILVNQQTANLLKNEKLLADTQKTAIIGSWEIDLNQNTIRSTETAKKIFDAPEERLKGLDDLITLFGPDEKMQSLSHYIEQITTHPGNLDLELPMYQSQSKAFKWVRLTGQSEFEKEKCLRIFGTIQDIHQRKYAELASQKHLLAIEKQNEVLREIAWTQSHVVRAPVARILGLLYLLQNNAIQYDMNVLDYLIKSTKELDEIIHSISQKTNQEHTAEEQVQAPVKTT